MWFERDGPEDHLLSDLDGPAYFLLVMDHQAINYFKPWTIYTNKRMKKYLAFNPA